VAFVSAYYLFLDSIQFSIQPIPEPNATGLIGLGALFFGRRLRKIYRTGFISFAFACRRA
jgi:hypothetical protein